VASGLGFRVNPKPELAKPAWVVGHPVDCKAVGQCEMTRQASASAAHSPSMSRLQPAAGVPEANLGSACRGGARGGRRRSQLLGGT